MTLRSTNPFLACQSRYGQQCVLKSIELCDEKEQMASSGIDLTALSHSELTALVQQLRQQLAEREHEIERLKQLLPARQTASATEDVPPAVQEPDPGSEEDLLAQLEQIYPEGR